MTGLPGCLLGSSKQEKQTRVRGFLLDITLVPDAGQTHGIHEIYIAVLKELVTTTGKDNGTKLVNFFPVFTGSPLVCSSVCNSQKAIHWQYYLMYFQGWKAFFGKGASPPSIGRMQSAKVKFKMLL